MSEFTNLTKYKVIDSYDESNQTGSSNLRTVSSALRVAQTFTVATGFVLAISKFYLKKVGSPTGNAYSKIYALSGGAPTGSALATSGAYVVSALSSSSSTLVTFTFEKMVLATGSYGISYEPDDLVAGTNTQYGIDGTSPTHSGTQYIYNGSTWSSVAGSDVIFYVNGELLPANVSKNSISPSRTSKYIHPWTYNEVGFKYNQALDLTTGQAIYYNNIGTRSWTNLNKS